MSEVKTGPFLKNEAWLLAAIIRATPGWTDVQVDTFGQVKVVAWHGGKERTFTNPQDWFEREGEAAS